MRKVLQFGDAGNGWSIVVRVRQPHILQVYARGTNMTVICGPYTAGGQLISIPEYRRCGAVPRNVSGRDVMEYCDFPNRVDAESLATALRWYWTEGCREDYSQAEGG